MVNNVTLLIVICMIFCLNINYTFPLHREVSFKNWGRTSFHHLNRQKACTPVEYFQRKERQKKMSSSLENALKRLTSYNDKNRISQKKSIEDLRKTHSLNDDDLRQYEQLVILKKYPFLDLKDLVKLEPGGSKNPRNSEKILNLGYNLRHDPSLCENSDDRPNVEIFSRGLSGFSMPLLKNRLNIMDKERDMDTKNILLTDLQSGQNAVQVPKNSSLNSLKNDVLQYEQQLHKNI